MAESTKIEWCDSTFNPWTGCTKVGPGCDHCYADGWAKRSGLVQWGPGAERRRTSAANWRKPLQWNAKPFFECAACGWRGERFFVHFDGDQCPHCCTVGDIKPARRRVFCASLADVFDNEAPEEWRADLFWLIHSTPNLDWLLVTKRIGNAAGMMRAAMLEIDPSGEWPAPWPNVWLGITVVNQAEADRDIPKLLKIPAAVRFLSMEPLLGPVNLRHLNEGRETNEVDCLHPWMWEQEVDAWRDTDDEWEDQFEDHFGIAASEAAGPMQPTLDWVIVGGESGAGARPMHPQWARDIRDQCEVAGVPFLFKQHGEWLATDFCDDDMASIPSKRTVYVSMDGSFHDGSEGVGFFRGDQETAWVGKKAAGRLLDGREHNGFPTRRQESEA